MEIISTKRYILTKHDYIDGSSTLKSTNHGFSIIELERSLREALELIDRVKTLKNPDLQGSVVAVDKDIEVIEELNNLLNLQDESELNTEQEDE